MSLLRIQGREPATVMIGMFLILLGISLLLDRLDLVSFRWAAVTWVLLAILGAYLALDGSVRRLRWKVFWGSGLFFFSLYHVLTKFGAIEHYSFYTMPAIMIAFGLSFLALYVFEPKEYVFLVPSVLLTGFGIVAILFWWDFLDWYDIRWAIKTYWPLAFVAWGIALLARRKRPV